MMAAIYQVRMVVGSGVTFCNVRYMASELDGLGGQDVYVKQIGETLEVCDLDMNTICVALPVDVKFLLPDVLSKSRLTAKAELEFRATQGEINAVAQRHHKWVDEMGWHNKTVLENLALVASEVGEAVNECRGAEPTAQFGEELADIVLRVMDLAVSQGVDLEDEILKKMAKNKANGTRGRKF